MDFIIKDCISKVRFLNLDFAGCFLFNKFKAHLLNKIMYFFKCQIDMYSYSKFNFLQIIIIIINNIYFKYSSHKFVSSDMLTNCYALLSAFLAYLYFKYWMKLFAKDFKKYILILSSLKSFKELYLLKLSCLKNLCLLMHILPLKHEKRKIESKI